MGTPVEGVCRKRSISDATFYNWHKKHGWAGSVRAASAQQLGEESAKLERLVAGPVTGQVGATGRVGKGLEPSRTRALVDNLTLRYGASQAQTCGVLKISRSSDGYASVAGDARRLVSLLSGTAHYSTFRSRSVRSLAVDLF